jgi:uncharacterized protein (TIGR00288 family)
MPEETKLAVFVDFENLALGFKEGPDKAGSRSRARKQASRLSGTFDITRVLERLVEKGKVIVKVAYADWTSFAEYRSAMHEAGIQLMEIPERGKTGKNFADIQLCVDAMDLCYAKEHVDTFVIVSGDSDFTPLVSKLKENGKHVIGLGMQQSTSELLSAACDEFIFYEDLGKTVASKDVVEKVPKGKQPAMRLLVESLEAIDRENIDIMYSSLVKDTMKRKKPSFSESAYGYRSFSALLEAARGYGLVTLRKDARSGTWVVDGFGSE